jgi:hypothetical protein
MASGNRVEQLESRVRELEASVDGLTDELLECKQRLAAIEEEVGPEMDIIEGKTTVSSNDSGPGTGTGTGTGGAGANGSTGGGSESDAADTSNTDETGEEDSSDEIIVA